ncbi:MAG TPA: DUF5330 domain-containing protein [Hyphomicrobiaceae bacterium]|nr:DUF5330 domain-containing protein [Hyphomicrobiaceae bacterium]
MLSFRTLVLLGVTVYLLPSDPARQEAFIKTASQAFQYTTTVCEREPELCARANTVFQDLKSKAQFGAGVIYTLITSQQKSGEPKREDASAPAGEPRWDGTARRTPASQGTLKPGDLAPAWGGNASSPYPISYE